MELAVDVVRDTLLMSLILISPLLAVAIVVGLIVAVLQSITSIQEATMTFVPKLFAVSFTVMLIANWMLITVIEFTARYFELLASMSPAAR